VEEFKVLTDREHVLARANVYLGSTTCEPVSGIINYQYQTKNVVPALIKCVEEIFQNSIDEHIRTEGKFAKNISLEFIDTLDGTEICITDDGRGIPLDKINDTYRPILAWTELRAGSNFDDSKRVGAGTNGMGAALVNIFSTSFIGQTCDGKNQVTVTCSDNMQNISHKVNKSTNRGTRVKFIPDLVKFGLMNFDQDHLDIIFDRFTNLAVLYPGIVFSFAGKPIVIKNIKQVAKNFHNDAVSYEQDKIAMVFAPAGADEEFRVLSYVNGIYIKNGGSHVDFVMSKVIDNLRQHIKKKHKIDVLPSQIRQHLLFASWVSGFPALKFDSQSKERVTNSVAEVSAHFSGVDFDKISKQILNTESIIDPMIAAILYKKQMAENLAMQKKQKAVSKTRIVNHIAATDPNPENRSCFIVEGLSALGSLIAVRNPKLHGALPLKGKVLNVRGMKPTEILKNKEVFELLSVIGLEFNKPVVDLNYGKIVIMVDADVDGAGSIQCLLLNLFSNWPELFTQGRIYRAMTPLYVCTKGKNTELFYNKTDFDKFNSKGWEVAYCKGLGTMSKDAYEKCINDPFLVRLSANDADFEHLEIAFGESAEKRKTWMMG
jgi:DNA gyrase/topoisomerase IV subunit B